MNDSQRLLNFFRDGFVNPTTGQVNLPVVNLALTAIGYFYPEVAGNKNEGIPNTIEQTLPDGTKITFSRSDFDNAFLETLSKNPDIQNPTIDPVTYGYLENLREGAATQTPPVQFSEPTSTTGGEIRREELVEMATKAKDKNQFEKAVAEQKKKVEGWEKKIKSNPDIIHITSTTNDKDKTLARKISLDENEQKDLQALKNLYEENKATFKEGVKNRIAQELNKETEVKADSEITLAYAEFVAEDLTNKMEALPPIIGSEIFVYDVTPLSVFLTEKISTLGLPPQTINAINVSVNDIIDYHNEIADIVGSTTTFISTSTPVLYPQIKKSDGENFEVSTKPTAEETTNALISALETRALVKNEIESIAKQMGTDISQKEIEALTNKLVRVQQRFGENPSYLIRPGIKGKQTPSEQTQGKAIYMDFSQNKIFSYVREQAKDKVTGKIKGYTAKFAIKVGSKSLALSALKTKVEIAVAKYTAIKVAAGKAVKGGVSKVVTAIAGASAIAGLPGWLIAAITWLVASLLSKIGPWLKKHWKATGIILGLSSIGLGAFLGIPALIAAGGLLVVGGIGLGTIAATAATGMGIVMATITGTLISLGITTYIMLISIPLFVILIMFIINTGAYMVPPSVSTGSMGGTLSASCPDIWPTNTGSLTQGAYAPLCSHSKMEAIDVGGSGNPVYATHDGSVSFAAYDPCLGKNIEIVSECDGVSFYTQYSHLISMSVVAGGKVKKGQQIGVEGAPNPASGTCSTGPHLHYAFHENKNYPNDPPFMMIPYIPKDVPRGCCNDTTPCNVSIP